MKPLLLLLVMSAMAGCASNQTDISVTDPLESVNRRLYQFDSFFSDNLVNPFIALYRDIVPRPLRKGFNNVLLNLRTIDSVINGLLQANFKSSWIDTQRILINSTAGIGGIFDIAKRGGLEYQNEDLGQTLAVWGIKSTAYLYIPFIGPTTMRDLPGSIWNRLAIYDALIVDDLILTSSSIEQRSEALLLLDDVKDNSLDNYSALLNAYAQKRKDLIVNGKVDDQDFFDLLDQE